MNKSLLSLSFFMGVVVLSSNFLVQFPINNYGLNEILTYGAFTYPIAFLITDLANRSYGKIVARKIVYLGFVIGISFTLFLSNLGLILLDSFSFPTKLSSILHFKLLIIS